MNSILRGVFLTADKPALTARFYQEVAGIKMEEVGSPGGYTYWKFDDGDFQIAIHEASAFSKYSYPVDRNSNSTHLYFKISDQKEFLSHLEQMKLKPHATDDVVVTVEDPDGRKVMFGTA